MALTFVGAVSVGSSGEDEIRRMLFAALGCNLAWGLADAVMYVVRAMTDRAHTLTLIRTVRAADERGGRALLQQSLSTTVAPFVTETEIEGIRRQIVALRTEPPGPEVNGGDLLAALAVFLVVVTSTFPVVLPFILFQDVGTAKAVSRIVALAMLFFGGLALSRYAGYGRWKAGFMMAGLGSALVVAIMALGG
jgi:VIT1/CCC1 family predicted Fe2+/Mn2+ transporter